METRTIKVNEKDFTFINAYHKNRSGFTHDCELHIGYQRFDCHAQYYNRTWESYTYQSVMVGALYNYKEYVEKHLKERFLADKGYKRMTPQLKAEFETLCADNQQLKDIAEVRNELNHGTWWQEKQYA